MNIEQHLQNQVFAKFKIQNQRKSIKSSSFRIFVEKRRQSFVNFTIFLNFRVNDVANQTS